MTKYNHLARSAFQKIALEQWFCSGALLQQLRLFQNFAPEQCTEAKLQHLCAGLEWTLRTLNFADMTLFGRKIRVLVSNSSHRSKFPSKTIQRNLSITLEGAIQKTQCCSSGIMGQDEKLIMDQCVFAESSATGSTACLQGRGWMGQSVWVPWSRYSWQSLPPREQSRDRWHHSGQIRQVQCVQSRKQRSKNICDENLGCQLAYCGLILLQEIPLTPKQDSYIFRGIKARTELDLGSIMSSPGHSLSPP